MDKSKLMKIHPVILSGGSGTRLWPLSRRDYPKQFLTLESKNSLLQDTILRLRGLESLADPIIVCSAIHRFLVADQCQQINIKNPTILLEPVGRNTAPAIAAAAFQSLTEADDALLLVLSADQVIKDIDAFHQTINIALQEAQRGKLVTFGIKPTAANTGYGYIKSSKDCINGTYKVERFVEKPNKRNAQVFLKQDNYLWNSGIFMFKAARLIDELIVHSPETVFSVNDAVKKAEKDLDFIRLDKKAFESSPSESIDYALMEKSKEVVVIPMDAQWNDIGAWDALYDIGKKDTNGNVIKGDAIIQDTTNTYVNSNYHMVATIGVDNLIIVNTPDVTFIATQDKAKEVNSMVKLLNSKQRDEAVTNQKVYCPWGWYDSIEKGLNFQVKKLFIKPGAKLSLQMHYKRAEHWVVVRGTATVVNGKDVLTLKQGESSYIPVGQRHSLENKTKEQLEIIEIQSGMYLKEDDIVRFEDLYGRVK